jgi:hypothetical protein
LSAVDKNFAAFWRGDLDVFEIKPMAQRVQDECFHSWPRVCDNPDRYVQDFVCIRSIPGRYQMELRHLRYFLAVGEEQHFGRAAARLHLAQPALSRQIQDLEREVGFLLFERLPRGVRLSEAGRVFLSDARRILQDVDDAKRRAERMVLSSARSGSRGSLSPRVGIAPEALSCSPWSICMCGSPST